ncbi:MAG: hypothetical protein HPY54_02160 [Chthonomonadetes bacterium]|nr:hypothetical protein [Chthonomonadetes bacterium]
MRRVWTALLLVTICVSSYAQGYWDAYAPQRVFTTQEQPVITVSGVGTHRLQVQVYHVDESKIVRHQLSAVSPHAMRGKPASPPQTVLFTPPSARRVYHARDVRLPRLPAGMYVVLVNDGRGRARGMLLWVSDIGLVVKYAPAGKMMARVVRLQDGKGVPEARVAFYTTGKTPAFQAATGADGVVELPLSEPVATAMVWAFRGAHRAAAYVSLSQPVPFVQYVFTDRPVYRPGQKVFFKGIVRERVENDYRVPSFESAKVTLLDPENQQIGEQTIAVSERGTFAGAFQLPEETPLGGYSFRVVYMRAGQEEPVQFAEVVGGFEVQEYRKPEFRVKMDPAQQVYIRGETATFRLHAEYYFGAPVAGARVKYYVYKRYLWDWEWTEAADEYRELYGSEEEEEEEVYGGYGEMLLEGETTTDERGDAIIRIPTRAHAEPCSYAVEAEVTDLSLRTEEASASADVYPAAVRLTWRSDAWWLEPGQTARFELRASHPRTKVPLATAVKVSAYRVRWIRLKGEQWKREEIPLWSRTVRTDQRGIARIDFTAPREGEYLLRASATDGAGRFTQKEYTIGVYTPIYRGEPLGAPQTLQVTLDRKNYLPGERAKVLIRSSVPDAEVWLTVEGRKLFASQVVRLNGGVGVVELPTEWQHAPNAFVSANLVNRKTLIRVQRLLRVAPKGKILQVEVIPSKERYLPNEEAVYTIRTRDDEGKPVSAEVALGVVDEAIYSIMPDYTPDIRRFFWGATPNAVNTSVSFGREYAAGAAKEAARREMEEVRRRFEDTAFWNPAIVTDNNGEAQVRFSMPENLTEWRATARAVTADTAVGTVRSYAKTFKPLLVRLQTPRFLTQGDRSVISGVVHNYTEGTQEVVVSLQVSAPLRIVEGQDRRITLPPQGQANVDWTVEVTAPGEATLTLTARSAQEFDGMELTLPAYPRGVPRLVASASVVKDAVEKRFNVAPHRVPGSLKLVVRVAPSWFGTAIGALDEILTYPYGCIEQTVHPMLSALRVLEAMDALDLQNADLRKRAEEAVRRGVIRLSGMQFWDGSWGYTEHAESNAMWTALALEALSRAKSAGFSVSDERIGKGINALYRLIGEIPSQPPDLRKVPKNKRDMVMAEWVHRVNQKAHALCSAASISPQWARKPLMRLYESRRYLGTSSQCALVMALRSANLPTQAKVLEGEILARAVQTPTTAFWREATPFLQSRSEWLWYAQDTYATAWVARILARYDPRNPLLACALRWLAEKRQGDYWYSTNDTAQVVMALVEYAYRRPEVVKGSHRVRVVLNGEVVKELEYRAEDWLKPEDVIPVPTNRLREGQNVLRIEHQGEGEVAAATVLRYFEPTERVQATAQQMRVERIYLKRVPRQLTPRERADLRRRYGDESEYLWELRPAKGVFRPGEQMVVKLVVHCATDIYYGVIDDPKPAGFEFVERLEDRYDWRYWYSRREVRDDRVAFLSTFIPRGKSVITYTLRAERPGQVRARPVQAFGMYLPEINASSTENMVRTLKR